MEEKEVGEFRKEPDQEDEEKISVSQGQGICLLHLYILVFLLFLSFWLISLLIFKKIMFTFIFISKTIVTHECVLLVFL